MKSEKIFLKLIEKSCNCMTFAATVPVLLTVGSACGSFLRESIFTYDNTPPMPLTDAHLGGLCFLGHK